MKVREQKVKPKGPVCVKESSFTFPVRAAEEDSWEASPLPTEEEIREAEVGSISVGIIKDFFLLIEELISFY